MAVSYMMTLGSSGVALSLLYAAAHARGDGMDCAIARDYGSLV
jgi:hypothetical protein